MRVFVAEKPSLGRAIADALGPVAEKGQGFIRLRSGDVVTWCIGHLLEQAQPEHYDPALQKWRREDLPIIPEQWQLKPRAAARNQLSVVKQWLKQASDIVHAGDPDREGQLLVDEVLNYAKLPASKLRSVQRLLISDLNLPAVKAALTAMRSNQDPAVSFRAGPCSRGLAVWH